MAELLTLLEMKAAVAAALIAFVPAVGAADRAGLSHRPEAVERRAEVSAGLSKIAGICWVEDASVGARFLPYEAHPRSSVVRIRKFNGSGR